MGDGGSEDLTMAKLYCNDCKEEVKMQMVCGCDKRESSIPSTDLVGFSIPAHLEEDFDHLMDMALSAADTMDRESWSVQERELYDWITERKYKPNAGSEGLT